MRQLVPATLLTVLVAALAACGPQGAAGTAATPGASTAPGASAAPGGTSTTAPGGTAATPGGAAGPVTDLAARFPMPGAKRRVVYAWTSVTKATNLKGTDDVTYEKCETSCISLFDRTLSDGTLDRNDAKAYPAVAEGVILPVQTEFNDVAVDLAEALKKGGHAEEDVTVRAGRYKTIKVTHGTSRTWTWWIQKPWVIKAEFSNPSAGANATMELEKLE